MSACHIMRSLYFEYTRAERAFTLLLVRCLWSPLRSIISCSGVWGNGEWRKRRRLLLLQHSRIDSRQAPLILDGNQFRRRSRRRDLPRRWRLPARWRRCSPAGGVRRRRALAGWGCWLAGRVAEAGSRWRVRWRRPASLWGCDASSFCGRIQPKWRVVGGLFQTRDAAAGSTRSPTVHAASTVRPELDMYWMHLWIGLD